MKATEHNCRNLNNKDEDNTLYVNNVNHKLFISKIREGYSGRQAPDEGLMAQRSKRCDDNQKDLEKSLYVININNKLFISKFSEGSIKYMMKAGGTTVEILW